MLTGHVSSPTVKIHSYFSLCCGYLFPIPAGLPSEFLGFITLAMTITPWNGLHGHADSTP